MQGQKECIPCGNDLTTASNGTIEDSDCFGMFVALFNYLSYLITLYCNWVGGDDLVLLTLIHLAPRRVIVLY